MAYEPLHPYDFIGAPDRGALAAWSLGLVRTRDIYEYACAFADIAKEMQRCELEFHDAKARKRRQA